MNTKKAMRMRTWKDNAAEFAALDRGEGWQFAVLVACSVERRQRGGQFESTVVDSKVSIAEFARAASTSDVRVARYLDAWQTAASKGWVQDATELRPDHAHAMTLPDKPWRAKDGGVYDASRTGGQINDVGQIADKAARDPEYAKRVVEQVTKSSPQATVAARKALDEQYDAASKPITPTAASAYDDGVDLVAEFRGLHRGVDRIVQLINEGKAVVSDDTRDAILREVKWLRTALGYIEDGVSSDSLSSEIAEFLGAQS